MFLSLTRPLAFFDLEATGLTIGHDRIIEVSVLRLQPDGSKEKYTQKVNPQMPIPEVVVKLTGIADANVKDEPTFSEIAKELAEFLDGCDLAGYNSNKFDVPLLVDEFLRVGQEFDISKRKLVDVQNIFHKMEQRTLAAAYKFYCEKELINAHTADADVNATFEILESQLQRYDSLEKNVDYLHTFTNMFNCVDLAGRIVFNEKGEEIINFGKHKGKNINAVFAAEPSYYDWILKGDFARQTKAVFTQLWNRYNEKKLADKAAQLAEKFNQK